MNLYKKIRHYIGWLELVVIMAVTAAVCWFWNQHEKQVEKELALHELKMLVQENEVFGKQQSGEMQQVNEEIRVLDSIYLPFIVDSLCRYTDNTCTKGFITLTKYAPSYEKLCSAEKDYYMWVALDKFFPGGQLVKVTGIAQNEQFIQFHFSVNSNDETLEDMLIKLDSTLNVMQQLNMDAQSR
ncbi:MAG: hypothetical protein J6J03_00665 [Tyzzerella sp.]|nr:hypothetical protein [Tyzzerella sp.]